MSGIKSYFNHPSFIVREILKWSEQDWSKQDIAGLNTSISFRFELNSTDLCNFNELEQLFDNHKSFSLKTSLILFGQNLFWKRKVLMEIFGLALIWVSIYLSSVLCTEMTSLQPFLNFLRRVCLKIDFFSVISMIWRPSILWFGKHYVVEDCLRWKNFFKWTFRCEFPRT